MKKVLVAGAALVVLAGAAGGGYYWAQQKAKADVEAMAQQVRGALGDNSVLTYDVTVNPFKRSADLTHLSLRLPSGAVVRSDHGVIVSDGSGHASLHVDHPSFKGPGTYKMDGSASALQIEGIAAAAGTDLTLANFPSIALDDLSLSIDGSHLKAAEVHLDTAAGKSKLHAVGLIMTAKTASASTSIREATITGPDFVAAYQKSAGAKLAGDTAQPSPYEVDLQGLSLDTPGAPHAIVVGRASLTSAVDANGSNLSRLGITDIVVTPANSSMAMSMNQAGFPVVRGAVGIEISYNPATGVLDQTSTFDVLEVGKLTMMLSLSGIRPDDLAKVSAKPQLGTLMGSVSKIKLVSAKAAVMDQGGLDQAIAFAARKDGTAPDAQRAKIVSEITAERQFSILPFGEQLRAALITVVQRSGTIGIAAQPTAPISLLDIVMAGNSNPVALAARLNVTVGAAPRQ